jgi:RHS repeat-associated protein
MSNQSNTTNQTISLPEGGGSIKGMGESFSPDLHTGTGNFSVPIALPPGRNGFQPQLGLVYSTGNGNGPFGLGWQLSIPGVSRKTAQGLPQYRDETPEYPENPEHNDIFLLSGAEDLVPLRYNSVEHFIEYRPRTEGLFALIRRYYDSENDYWLVKTKDGLSSWYGTPQKRGNDPATVYEPDKPRRVFSWMLSETRDTFGNRIVYAYERDLGIGEVDTKRTWNQLYLKSVQYADYRDTEGENQFLIGVHFNYDAERPDPFSVYQSGFEIRTRRRCRDVEVYTYPEGQSILTRATHFEYAAPDHSKLSLLRAVQVTGYDGEKTESLPPLEFSYSSFEPNGKRFEPVTGRELPMQSLTAGQLELVDLNGNGLPDLLQLNGSTARYWSNRGNGRFDLARDMRTAPAGVSLNQPGVMLMDANGEGRADLVFQNNGLSGYFPTTFKGEWDSRSFRKYRYAPSFDPQDPEVKLLDLNGDGVTDAMRSGARFEYFFNDAEKGWRDALQMARKPLEEFPDVNFSDPRVRLADMSGDGMQDIVLISDRNFDYWPNLGYGRWGRRITMRNAPRLPRNYNPKRLLLGDIAGNGPDDLIYVDYGKIWLWINQNGNSFSDPILIEGTPLISDVDDIRLADLYGTGTSGLLFTSNQNVQGRNHWFFLDLAGRHKPYLLHEMRNNLGALTRVEYRPSTEYFLRDYDDPRTRWKTPLPFPVLVVSRVEVIDQISKGKLATEYRYHHGYWDGVEREFRGFGMVEQFDTETFDVFNSEGLHGGTSFISKDEKHYSPPLHTKTWFHQGPIDLEEGDWHEPDRSHEYWSGDNPLLNHTEQVNDFLKNLPNSRIRREALRTLRGSILRTELYALDDSPRQDRPYTVTEQAYGLMELESPSDGSKRRHIFFPFAVAQRTTQWERGEDPMTQFSFTEDYDTFGQPQTAIAVACPRSWRKPGDVFPENRPFLATVSRTVFAYSGGESPYIKDRTARTSAWELKHRGNLTLYDLKAQAANLDFLEITAQSISYYDGEAFTGLLYGQIGAHGTPVRSETLILTEALLQDAWKNENGEAEIPVWLESATPDWPESYPQAFRDQLPALGGYRFHDGTGPQARGYWVEGGRTQFDIHLSPAGKGLALAMRDALDRETTIQYDAYQLLPEKVTDPLGLIQRAWYDYRVLQPRQTEDANGNRSRFDFSPLGLANAFFVNGKEGESEGDTPEKPSRRLEYDFFAFMERGEPVFASSIAREYHALDTDVPTGHADDTIVTVEYSDGFGRQVQTRVQAEDVLFGDVNFGTGLMPADIGQKPGASTGRQRQPGEPDNVVVSGWKIYNNKGLVVQQYEPYYDKGFAYATPEDYQLGQKSEMYYDPRGQVIRTMKPDGSEQRVIYGTPFDLTQPQTFSPTPWEAYTYDANDLAPLCQGPNGEPLAAHAPEEHHFTPAHIEIDALGRTVKAVQRNRAMRQKPGDPMPALEEYVTLSTYDIRGNLLTVTDALGRLAFQYTYDLTFDKENGSRPWRIESIDAGLRRVAFHALGMEIERRDSKGSLTLQGYRDPGNRPTHLWACNHPGEAITLRQRLLYGDTTPQPPEGGVLAGNYKGKLYRHYDEAGLVEMHGYDFKGNPLATSRRTIRNEAVRPFLGTAAYTAFVVDWQRPDAETHYLETKAYRSDTAYDALNRPKRMIFPEDISGERKTLLPTYNRAGALETVTLQSPSGVPLSGGQGVGVEYIAYNAKGQRTLLALANGLMTRYEYDPHTFRLVRLRTEKYRCENGYTFVPDGGLLQDLAYRYDLAGNIIQIQARGTEKGINGIFAFDRDFTYDAIYRLLSGTGIEHKAYAHAGEPWLEMLQHHNNDLTQARRYRQRYTYDPAGNILELAHRNLDGEAGHYTRSFTSESANNRLQSMRQNGLTYHYTYDPNGNMTREATNRRYHWNYADQLVRYSNQTDGSAPTVDACYLYGADGIRVKKVVLNGGGLLKTTTYIGEVFEYCTRGEQAYNLIHLMDGEQRIALLRVGAPFSGDESQNPALQYILGDHLGNSSMTTNGFGTLVHREEFTPYGETSFGGYGEKRYRFTGKERDEESGLSYHRARYYAGWLGKWVSADPLFFKDMKGAKTKFKQNENKINLEFIEYGKNIYFMKLVGLYDYCRNNPVGFDDKNGEDEKKQQDRWIWPDNEEFKPEFNVETPLLDRAVFYKSIKNDKGEEIGRCEVLYVTADASVQDGVSLALGVLRTESSADGLRAGVEFLTAEAMLSRKGVKAQVTLVESKVGGTVVKDVPIPKLGNADVNASFVLGASAGFEFSQERVRLKGAYVVGVDVSLEFGSRPLMDGVRRAISDSVPTMLDHVTTSG